jgi:hypothetical protein
VPTRSTIIGLLWSITEARCSMRRVHCPALRTGEASFHGFTRTFAHSTYPTARRRIVASVDSASKE